MVRRAVPNREFNNVDITMEFTTHQYLILTVHENGGIDGGAVPGPDGEGGGMTERFELKYTSLSGEKRAVPQPEEEKNAKPTGGETDETAATVQQEGTSGGRPGTGDKPEAGTVSTGPGGGSDEGKDPGADDDGRTEATKPADDKAPVGGGTESGKGKGPGLIKRALGRP